jgi:1-deoxy-D-xylulose-5-phosphate reductoisomerase
VLIGATGSIGASTLEVVRRHPDRLRLVGIAAHRDRPELDAIAREFAVRHVVASERDGEAALTDLATLPAADMVVMAAVGTVGLLPTMAALAAGKDVALASKEILVLAGRLVMACARRHGARILPVDSEHNAVFQCLQGVADRAHLRRIILTASGGPFRTCTTAQMRQVGVRDAMAHPNWSMGPKITVDSATMANKGLEMIEARWLFDLAPEQIDVVIHPQSIIHSMVECIDGSILAQMSPPSMTFAIQHALLHPDRAPAVHPSLDFRRGMQLSFAPPDETRFPCLRLARQVLPSTGTAPAVYNAANEEAVRAFIENGMPFLAIPEVIEHCLQQVADAPADDLAAVLAADTCARAHAQAHIESLCPN